MKISKNNCKILFNLIFILALITSFSVCTVEIKEMLESKGEYKTFNKINYNVHYNKYGEYNIELIMIIFSVIIQKVLIIKLLLEIFKISEEKIYKRVVNGEKKKHRGNYQRYFNFIKKQ